MHRMVMAHRHRRSRSIVRHVRELARIVLALVALLALVARPAPVRAEDRVAALNRMLGSSSDKTRLAAVLALAKLGEPRVDKPLIRALHDPSARVRGVAAAALGRLDCDAALPALRVLAQNDADPDVRNAASTAAMKISTVHPGGRPARPQADGEVNVEARRLPPGGERSRGAYAVEPHPEVWVLINSSTDESPGTADPAARRDHAELIRRALLDRLRSETAITAVASDARRWSLDARHHDHSVTRLAATRSGNVIEVDAQLRIAISDDSGKMLSFLSGGAKVQVPAARFDARYLPNLRKEALDNAMRGMFGKLLAQLLDPA
jgi:hypothetical protein